MIVMHDRLPDRERLRLLCALAFWAATYLLFVVWNQLSDFPPALWQTRRTVTTLFGAVLFFGFTRLMDRSTDLPLRRRTPLLIGAAATCCGLMVMARAGVDLIVPALGEAPSTWPRHLRFGLIWAGYFAGGALAFLSFAPASRREAAAPTGESPLIPAAPDNDVSYTETLWVSRGRETVRVPVDAIDWIEAEGDYVRLHARNGGGLMRGTLSGVEAELDPHVFARVHRSAICRRSAVAAMVRKPSGALAVRLDSGAEVPVGRSYRDSVVAIVGTRSDRHRATA